MSYRIITVAQKEQKSGSEKHVKVTEKYDSQCTFLTFCSREKTVYPLPSIMVWKRKITDIQQLLLLTASRCHAALHDHTVKGKTQLKL